MPRSLVFLLSTLVAAVSAGPSLRAITVPEASGTSYELCTDAELAAFSPSLMAESNDCTTRSTYDWNSAFLPTTTERQELCDCTALINKLQTMRVPHCSFYRSGAYYSYKQLAEYAFGLCVPKGSSSTSSSNLNTLSPGSSDTTDTSSSKKSSNQTGVIAGVIVGVVVVVGFVVGVILRKRKNNANGKEEQDQGEAAPRDSQGELSPLGDDGNGFTSMSPRKSKDSA